MNDDFRQVAIRHGFDFNLDNGAYENGKSYGHIKKLEVATALIAAQNATGGGGRPNITAIQQQCKVSWHFVRKIEKELSEYGRVLAPNEKHRQYEQTGPGSKTLDEFDAWVILQLYLDDPSRSLPSYVRWLEQLVGTQVSESTMSRFLKEAFPYSATFHRPNLVPYDKFRPENCMKAIDYLHVIAHIDPHRIKFGDEKSLKGKEVFNRKVRRHPMTGEIPPLYTTPDLTNTYSLTGFCGIDRRSTAVFCAIHDGINDATEFSIQVELAMSSGFFHPGDVMVLDNAQIHVGGENTVLEDWLWSRFGVFVLFLPPRSPEFNPIELVWNTLVVRLKKVPLDQLYDIGSHSCAIASQYILSDISHSEVGSFYKKCNLLK